MIAYEGHIVRLRPLRPTDGQHSVAWRNNPQVRDNALGYRLPVTEVMERLWLESAMNDQSRTRVVYAIERRANRQLVGFIHLADIDWISRVAHFGITIGETSEHRKGLATEAMHLLFRYAFLCLDLRKICLQVAEYNQRAKNLYARFGFGIEGTLRAHVYLDAAYHDVAVMALFKDTYLRKYRTLPRPRRSAR